MLTRSKLEEKIKRKEQEIREKEYEKDREIREMDIKLREAKAYIQALQDLLKSMPKNEVETNPIENRLRVGSAVEKTYKLLKTKGSPMHVMDILVGIGKNQTTKERVSLSSSLGGYVRTHNVFTRPSPNTFGLLEWDKINATQEPPEDFGIEKENKDDDVPF